MMCMTCQKRVAILGAALLAALFIAANAHLVTVAIRSQPACVAADPDEAPGRTAC